jgi:hypothetical protein
MVKVSCNCMSYGCHGKEVDHRTHHSHAIKDRTLQGFQQATEAAEHVIQNQLDTITHHLATTTLSNVASSPEAPILLSSGISSPPVMRSSSQACTHRLLERLSEIETSTNVLNAEVTTQLHRSTLPSFLDSQSFPLASLIGKCRLLDADLTKVTSKSAAVTAAKDTIKNQLDYSSKTSSCEENLEGYARGCVLAQTYQLYHTISDRSVKFFSSDPSLVLIDNLKTISSSLFCLQPTRCSSFAHSSFSLARFCWETAVEGVHLYMECYNILSNFVSCANIQDCLSKI